MFALNVHFTPFFTDTKIILILILILILIFTMITTLQAEQSRLREELEQLRKNAQSRRFYWCTDSKLKDALEEVCFVAAPFLSPFDF